jgi:hypothetical protein
LAGVLLRPGPSDDDRRAWPGILAGALLGLALPPAAPYAGESTAARPLAAAPAAMLAVAPSLRRELVGDDGEGWAALLRGLGHGGAAALARPTDDRLPDVAGRALSWLPPAMAARPRVGFAVEQGAPADKLRGELRQLYYYMGCAVAPAAGLEPGYPAQAWRRVLELADAGGHDLGRLFAELTRLAGAWDTAPGLRGYLVQSGVVDDALVAACDRRAPAPLFADSVPDAGWQWNRLLHYWGRGFLPADELPERLAAVLALRIVADHLFRLDHPEAVDQPGRYLRRLQLEALLSHGARERILSGLRARLPGLWA